MGFQFILADCPNEPDHGDSVKSNRDGIHKSQLEFARKVHPESVVAVFGSERGHTSNDLFGGFCQFNG